MSRKLRFGDPVVCTDPAQAGLTPQGGASVGLLAEVRKTDGRVQYLSRGRSVWVPLRGVRAARPEEIEGTLEETISALLSLLGATEMEFVSLGAGRCRLTATHGALLLETVDSVRRRLGDRLLTCLIRPQGMHRIQTVLEIAHAGSTREPP